MDTATLNDVLRRFPLVGWARPACPPLPARVREIADIAADARQKRGHNIAEAAHALNKAALLASDCGLTDLAHDLCWQHINTYVDAGRGLTTTEAGYMLEPVHNLARLQIRADSSGRALNLLNTMYEAVTNGNDLVVDGNTLPLALLIGTSQEHRKLRQWVWLQLLTDGTRALALAGRWKEAAQHATVHKGVGLHLMEGRQAVIIAHLLQGESTDARAMLDASTPTQPWEQQVADCLAVMCADADDAALVSRHTGELVTRFFGTTPASPYTIFRTRLGLTITTLAANTGPEAAAKVLTQIVAEAVNAADGYAARDILAYPGVAASVPDSRRKLVV